MERTLLYKYIIFTAIYSGIPVTAEFGTAVYKSAAVICVGPEIAEPVYSVSQSDCQALCDRRAGCVNVQVFADDHCTFHGQCEGYGFCPSCRLLQNTEAVNTECYWRLDGQVSGREYRGTISKSQSDHKCLRWDVTFQERHPFQSEDFAELDISAAADYCRNPGDKQQPFCITDNDQWDYCDVPVCQPYYGGYAVLDNMNCPADYLNGMEGSDETECQNHCDDFWNCVAAYFNSGECYLKSYCIPSPDIGGKLFIKTDFSGWSLYKNKICTSPDPDVTPSENPYDCIDQCIDRPACVAAVFSFEEKCLLETECDWLVDSDGWHTYRMLDAEVAGYEVAPELFIHGIQHDFFLTTSIRGCADHCRRHREGCDCFVAYTDENEQNRCTFYTECPQSSFFSSSSAVTYFPKDFETYGFNLMSETWCIASDVATEFPSVPTAGECVYLCKQRGGCMNAVFDFFRKVCYLKSSCEKKEESMHHDLYQKQGQWSAWSDPLKCDALEEGCISQQRTCMYGEICEGDNTRCYEKCHPLMSSYGKSWKGKKLLHEPLDILTTNTLRGCLVLCQRNCLCNSVNYRTQRLQGLQNTDNCELLYFTYEDIESVLALDIDYRFTILYGLESVM